MKIKPDNIRDSKTVAYSLEDLYEDCLDDSKVEFSEFSDFYAKFPDLKKRYTEEKKIDSGGMKTIYKVFDQHLGRFLAMAKLNDHENEINYMPFIREARLTANLEHPNIIKVHEIGFYDERKPYFTMELKTGDTLKDIIYGLRNNKDKYTNQYKLRELLSIFLKICDAISYSHSRKVIHLDIKPENIQVGDFGEVLVCDWGLAKVIGLEEHIEGQKLQLDPDLLNSLTLHSEIKGTPGYMAPEQVAKDECKDERTDIYALGALLYSLLTLEVPFEGNTNDILQNTVENNFIIPSERKPDLKIPESLEAIVLKAMMQSKRDRYQTVKELIKDVNRYLDGYSPAAEEAGLEKELVLFYKRNKKVCLLTLFFLLILAAGSAYFISSLKDSRDEALALRDEAVNQRKKAEQNLEKYMEEKSYLDPMLSSDPTPLILKLKDKIFSNMESNNEATMNALIKAFERISVSNPSHIPLYEIKSEVHFIRQEFISSLNALEKGRGRNDTSNKLLFHALDHLKQYNIDQGPAPIEIVLEALDKLEGFRFLVVTLMYYDSRIRSNKQEHVEVVKKVLQKLNTKWDPRGFKYEPEKKKLTLKGNIQVLSLVLDENYPAKSLLHTLDIDYLDLSGVERLVPARLINLHIKTVDIRGLKTNRVLDQSTAEVVLLDEKTMPANVVKQYKEKFIVNPSE